MKTVGYNFRQGIPALTETECRSLAKKIGARKYFEACALHGKGVADVLEVNFITKTQIMQRN